VNKLPQEVSALYLDAVDPGQDDFRKLSRLLFGAKERYRSARATILHTVEAAVAEEANRRFVNWRFEQPGGSGMGILRTEEERRAHGPDAPQDFYLAYEDLEEVYHLWHEKTNRWREEILASGGHIRRCVVFGGEEGPRWVYEPPETAIYDPAGTLEWFRQDPRTEFSFMLDPSEELLHYALLDDATIHKTGRRTTVADREVVEVKVGTVSWGYSPRIFHGFYAPKGTTDHLLLVDEEVGTILRVAARLEGREFYVAEATEIAYDEEFPEGTFRLEIPGVEFRQVDR
jgi:hypothetical protein